MRGRKPKATGLKVLDGNPGKRPLNAAEPQVPGNVGDAPQHLGEHGRRLWNELKPQLEGCGILKKTDALVFELLCKSYQHFRDADQVLVEDGFYADGGKGRRNPVTGALQESMSMLLRICAELGMSPTSRSRLQVEVEETKSKFSGLIAS